MTVPQTGATTDPQSIIAALQQRLDAALSEKAALAEALTTRNSEFGERIEYQAATLDVLRAMSASPGDPQPVFDLIVERARDLCEGYGATVLEFDGRLLLHRASTGIDDDPAIRDALIAAYPKAPVRSWPIDLAVLERRLIIVDDLEAEPNVDPALRNLTHKSVVAMPLMRGEVALGALALGGRERGGFSDSQIELLKTFAEQAVIAITSAATYRALQERTEELAQRNSEYGERIEHQSATIDVLKVMSASPGDAQPVFNLIVRRARELCNGEGAGLLEFDGELIHSRAWYGQDPTDIRAYSSLFPMAPSRASIACRAIIDAQIIHIRDAHDEPELLQVVRDSGLRSLLALPLLRDGAAIGSIALNALEPGGFSDTQVALLQTFAEQAVIAITSAETYRALQTRTSDLQETLEYQTATSDVLKVISRSAFDLQPVLDTVVETAARLCGAEMAAIARREGDLFRAVAQLGFPPDFVADRQSRGAMNIDRNGVTGRAAHEGRVIHVQDAASEPNYPEDAIWVGKQRTSLGVPLLRDNEVIGVILLARQRVEPFTDRQIELVSTFADQAVIAIENTRLITEQREALEQQTATAEVLGVINANPGNLAPVFDALLEKAVRLCGSAFGTLHTYDGQIMRAVATHGLTAEQEVLLVDRPPAVGQPTGRIASGEDVIHLLDAKQQDGYRVGFRPTLFFVDQVGARTVMWVALRKDRELLGFLTIFRREVRAFTEKEVELVQNFAAQAVIAMENARLITETREALEQQTATAEVLAVINASPGDLVPVFDAMLGKATRLCDAAFGLMAAYVGEQYDVVATHGVGPDLIEFLRAPPHPDPESALGRIERGEDLILFDDLADTDLYRKGDPRIRALVDLGGAHSYAVVALRKDQRLLGIIAAYRGHVRPFEPNLVSLLQSFAAQAVIAIENARLIDEQREALEQQTATAEVLQVINASPGNLAPVFEAMLDKALGLCNAAFGILWTYDGKRGHAVALRGVAPAFAEYLMRAPHPVDPGGVYDRLLSGEPMVHIADAAKDRAYRSSNPLRRALVELGRARTLLAVPLRKDNVYLGHFVIYRREVRQFSDKQIVLLQNFAAQAVIAMENARLLNEIRQRQEELRITFENMGDGVALFNETPRLVAWNRHFQEMFDLPDDLLEQHHTYEEHLSFLAARGDFGSGREAEEQLRVLVTSTDKPSVYERMRPDGRMLEIRRNPVPDGGFVLMFSDITERKRSEAEIRAARDAAEAALRDLKAAQANLIQAEKMASLGQLTAGIAHEIKNPLNFVNNFAALSVDLLAELKETAAPGFAVLTEEQRGEIDDVSAMLTSNLDKITEHGKRADGIVKAMLEHSRGSSGERRMVDLNALIEEALNLAYHGARAQDQSFNITLERDFGEGIAAIEVNPQDMTRVFLNIFANGFYAVTRRARSDGDARFVPMLKVTTRGTGDAVEIRVRDNGTGIPADIRDKLFQPFFTTKPTGEGTGLGLSITYDIVTQQHGGSIAVDSKVGDYSEFTIRLPRKP